MKKSIISFIIVLFAVTISCAQPAMQFNRLDCNGNNVDLYADLDAGKAVVLFFFMPNCGACPPPAQEIQSMANDINAVYPDLVKGYAFPFNNTTDCAGSISWGTTSSVAHFFTPLDSGANMVAYYGGFGMPTVVLVGGLDHRTLFSTQSFLTSDTTILHDSIMALYSELNGIADLPAGVTDFKITPNPSTDHVDIHLVLKQVSDLFIDIADVSGKQVAVIANGKRNGVVTEQYITSSLPGGNYFIRLKVNEKTVTRQINIQN